MPTAEPSSKAAHALPRIFADLACVHLCMIAALALAVFHPIPFLSANQPRLAGFEAVGYYSSVFLVLSLIFPLVFWINGFYTQSAAYRERHKAVVLRSILLAVLLFSLVNVLVVRHQENVKNAMFSFAALAMVAIAVPRMTKAAFLNQAQPRPQSLARRSKSEGIVLVLGGAGYIGSCLVRKLLAAGKKVRVMDRLIYGDCSLHDVMNHPNFELQLGDCRKITDVVAAVKGADSIVHLAAIVGDPACEVNRQSSREINYAATRMLIEVAKGNGPCRMVFASSCSVYGATDLLMDEYSNVGPISLYAETKVDSEQALLAAQSSTFHPVILRLATVFGLSYRTRFDLIVNLLTAKAYSEGAITIFNGTQWRPFIHVQDVANGITQVLGMPLDVVSGEVYNLGDSRMNFTLGELAEKLRVEFPETRVEYIENADRRNYRVSFEKIHHQLGFQCSLSLEDGIREIRRAFESKLVVDYRDARYSNLQFLKLCGPPAVSNELDRQVISALSTVPAPGHKSTLPLILPISSAPNGLRN